MHYVEFCQAWLHVLARDVGASDEDAAKELRRLHVAGLALHFAPHSDIGSPPPERHQYLESWKLAPKAMDTVCRLAAQATERGGT